MSNVIVGIFFVLAAINVYRSTSAWGMVMTAAERCFDFSVTLQGSTRAGRLLDDRAWKDSEM